MNKELNLRWEALTDKLETEFGKKPDLQAVLFLIGVDVLGQGFRKFTKEEKQDLMHIAVCRLLMFSGYYEHLGNDEAGWPHFKAIKKLPGVNLLEQEDLLKAHALYYFEEIAFISTAD